MKFRRKQRTKPRGPRADAINDRAEQMLFDEAFAEPLWRRPTPL